MIILIKALQLILSLSILVVLHELGHFLPAKFFKTKVEKFYLFFDPWFSLFKKKIGETEYGIGWLPLGGYVKISGMIDESMDKDQLKKPAKSWEFRSKPAWQRLIIMLGGVSVNLILGVFIYAMTLFFYGEKFLPNSSLVDGVWCVDNVSTNIGFKDGDKIISVDGVKAARFSDVIESLLTAKEVVVEREGVNIIIEMPIDFIEQLISEKGARLFYPRIPTIINGFTENSNAERCGLLSGDKIVRLNGFSITYFDEFKTALEKFRSQNVKLLIERTEGEITTTIEKTVFVDESGKIGFSAFIPSFDELRSLDLYDFKSSNFSFFSSFPAGYNKAIDRLSSYINQFILILKPSTGAYKGMGGFGSIGNLFPSTWDWEVFWNLTAFLSLILAFMNVLPIPALDGGHVMFLIYEIIVGRPAPDKIIEIAQVIGMVLLLSLLIFANANDIIRLF